jgi:hypothetical protein
MTPEELARKRAEDFAAKHAVMVSQQAERRFTGRPLRAGDFIQAETGGEIKRLAYDAHSAGECLEARAEVWALTAHKEHNDDN